jgi:hypothetical protein
MTVFFSDERPAMGTLAERDPLVDLPSIFSEERLMETVRYLAGEELAGRGFGTAELDKAAVYLAGCFEEIGLIPAGSPEGQYFQHFEAEGGEPVRRTMLRNVIGVIPGSEPSLVDQPVIIGAHYDHLGCGWPDVREGNQGSIHPGANDNASGVAVLLELARVLQDELQPDRPLVFAAFSGEEAGRLGSGFFVENYQDHPPSRAIGMLNLDTVGHLGDGPLLVLGAGSAREWPHILRGAGYVTGVRIEMVAEELDASDQVSFLEAGVPAVQLFSGPHPTCHQPTDTAERLDAAGLVKVASVAREVIEYLAQRREPLTGAPGKGHPAAAESPPAEQQRRVSLGTVPDFAYQGEGYRLSGVTPGSPAAEAGLKEGDVIISLAGEQVQGLQDVAGILRKLEPGESVSITYRRQGNTETTSVILAER